jgi:catechol 2,3-dioxygenase-like lactoylglutathione lyase family enzyme
MQLLGGINHVALISHDLDRLVDFYGRLFEARPVLDMQDEDLRIVLIDVGDGGALAAFQLKNGYVPDNTLPKFQRGRHDHVCLNAASEAAFHELRRRALAEGVSDGVITDVGPAQEFSFTDPDGWEGEVLWRKPGVPWQAHRRPAEWEFIEPTTG